MIKFNEVTWYSKIVAIILFVGVLPTLTFYIGIKYQQTKNMSEIAVENIEYQKPEVSSLIYTGYKIKFEYPSNYSLKNTWTGPEFENFEITDGNLKFIISNVPQGLGVDWVDYAPSENINGLNVMYVHDEQKYRMFASNKEAEYYILAFLPSEKEARDPEVIKIFHNILLSIKEI